MMRAYAKRIAKVLRLLERPDARMSIHVRKGQTTIFLDQWVGHLKDEIRSLGSAPGKLQNPLRE